MRIAYLALIELDVPCASLIHTREISEQMGELGHELHLFLPMPLVLPQWKHVHHHWIRWWGFDRLRQWFFFLESYLRIWRQHRITPFDMIYVREMERPPLFLWLCLYLHLPLFIEVNGWMLDDVLFHGAQARRLEQIRKFQQRLFDAAAGIVVSTAGNAANTMREYAIPAERVMVQELGVNPELFDDVDQIAAREELGIPKGEKVFLFAGSFHPHHDLKTVVKAFALLLDRLSTGVRLMLVGDGILRKDIEKMVEEKKITAFVDIIGVRPYEEMPRWFSAADVALVPLLKKKVEQQNGALATKLWEAMLAETKVLITDLPGTPSSLLLKNMAFIVPPENVGAMSAMMEAAIMDDETSRESLRLACAYVLEQRTWSKAATDTIAFMQQRLGRH